MKLQNFPAILCSLLPLLFCYIVTAKRANQAISVKGVLMCDEQPVNRGKVRLFSKFSKKTEMANEIDQTETDMMGQFQVEGFVARKGLAGNFEPTIKIYHKCDDEMDTEKKKKKKGGVKQRVVTVKIPKDYITEGRYAFDIFDAGRLNLQPIYPSENREIVPESADVPELAGDIFKQIFLF